MFVMVTGLSAITGFSYRYDLSGQGVPVIAHWIFQYAFADTCSTIVSGAMIGVQVSAAIFFTV